MTHHGELPPTLVHKDAEAGSGLRLRAKPVGRAIVAHDHANATHWEFVQDLLEIED
jgi:hypothetical protein